MTNFQADDRSITVLVRAHRRIQADELVSRGPPLLAKVSHVAPPKTDWDDPQVKAYFNELLGKVKEIAKLNHIYRNQVDELFKFLHARPHSEIDPLILCDFLAVILSSDADAQQRILDAVSATERMQEVLRVVNKEIEVGKLQQTIGKQVEQKLTKQQREHHLREQMKAIKKELGIEKDDKEALISKFRDKIEEIKAKTTIPAEASKAIDEEILKLSTLEKNSSEFNVTRTYLEWLTKLPWGITSVDDFDIVRAKDCLDKEHYGMDDVKKRILEFLAVGKLKQSVQGRIICLVGPPGVGKTSIGKSISQALKREFYRFSVGGLTDVAEIKGHRRTYVGAMPGKAVQALKATGTSNPVILIDEIDKIGRGYQGDPSSALLELQKQLGTL